MQDIGFVAGFSIQSRGDTTKAGSSPQDLDDGSVVHVGKTGELSFSEGLSHHPDQVNRSAKHLAVLDYEASVLVTLTDPRKGLRVVSGDHPLAP